MAIPRLEGKCAENDPKMMGTPAIFGGNRYLIPFNRGIATTSVRTGLAMTAFFKQQFILQVLGQEGQEHHGEKARDGEGEAADGACHFRQLYGSGGANDVGGSAEGYALGDGAAELQ